MNKLEWWQSAVFYQVYPRSFADGSGDGIGDLKGIIEHLDYLQKLGVDAIWLSPHYPSPQFDCGYDIADYTAVDPDYGTLDDFKALLAGLHTRGMRLILDLVLNHTSDQHPWFIESRSSRNNPRRDWYIWADGKNGGPPNNWASLFDLSAWERDEVSGQYYYHCFFKQQPDLNWRNPAVRSAMWAAARFWLELGVDGFRLDALGTIYENPDLTDHDCPFSLLELHQAVEMGTMSEEALDAAYKATFQHQMDLPGVHELMKELRGIVNEYPGRMLVGETDLISYHGSGDDELNLVFNFPLGRVRQLTAGHIRANQQERLTELPKGAWPCNTLGNHDSPRVKTRYGDGKNDEALARLWLALMLTLRGTPFLYNGEEIGMTDFEIESLGQIRDNVALYYYQTACELGKMPPERAFKIATEVTRDRCRTPMQWSGEENGGFSPAGVQTWLPLNPSYREGIHVAAQEADPGSMLNYYRTLLALRRQTPALIDGDYLTVHPDAQDYIAFLRASDSCGQVCLVVINLCEAPLSLRFESLPRSVRRLYATGADAQGNDDLSALAVAPFGLYIGEVAAA